MTGTTGTVRTPATAPGAGRARHRRARWGPVAALAAAALALAPATAATAVDDPPVEVPYLGVDAVAEQGSSPDAALSPVDVRFGVHDTFDRVVVDLVGTGLPGWLVEYQDDPRHQGSGFEVDVDGDAVLTVALTGLRYPTSPGGQEYVGPAEIRPEGAGAVEHVVVGAVYEGRTQVFLGMSEARPYRVYVLESPTRVVVDVAHAPAGPPFATEIEWLLDTGIAQGYADGEFRGGWPVSRQAMAAFVYRLAHDGAEAPLCDERPFPDVGVDNQFCGAIAWLAEEGLTTGYADGTYRPTEGISRQAMAAFFYRLYHEDDEAPACTVAPFIDVREGHPFCGEVYWMLAAEISEGYPDLTYRPTATVSRQAMAAFMYRAVVERGLTIA